jgi:hypothetical protein
MAADLSITLTVQDLASSAELTELNLFGANGVIGVPALSVLDLGGGGGGTAVVRPTTGLVYPRRNK